ncbi:MAG: helix-turn-helix transcriptional regulator [Candidatus Gastranaerophilaceae bacterium]
MLKFSGLQNFLTEKLQRKVTQAEIAQALQLDKSSVSLRIKRDTFLTNVHKQKIEDYFEIKIDDEAMSYDNNNSWITVKYYTDVIASCGLGILEQSQNFERIKISKHLINNYDNNKEYSVITAKGNSMSGAIEDGDKILVESYNNEQIIDNQIYVFCYLEEFFIKRLYKNIDQIIIKSDNTEFPNRYIEGNDINNIRIIGRVVALIRNYE